MAVPTSLDYLLLTLIARGVNTKYLLLARAGLSVGATQPALRRLEQKQLIKPGRPGPRGSISFSLTGAGKQELKSLPEFISKMVTDPPTEMDALLRVITLAIEPQQGKSRKRIMAAAADKLSRELTMSRSRLAKLADSDMGERYRQISIRWEIERIEAQLRLLRRLSRRTSQQIR
jgi:DNA-binding PadR family transcriptional regulator